MVYTIGLWYQIPASCASTFLYKFIQNHRSDSYRDSSVWQNVKKCGADAIFVSSAPESKRLSFFHRIRFSVLKEEGRQAVLLFYRELDSVVGIHIQ